ncbi:MAG: nucleotidyl transferase AbiEii/AbiGii toxin family protein [Candidatus Goldbacteria bacterium]|nr:nucleotidyl transferase AbiEii/AbiGii toxin family protein [Candidatus Goldiibacteriota bacterium]
MITISRCERFAVKYGVPPEVIENDYMTEWILSSIAGDDELKSKLIFRGGTCLQKVYFENYRFSEDLDFVFDAKYGVEDIYSDVELMLDSMKSGNREIIGWTIFMENGRIQIFVEYNVVSEIIKPEKNLNRIFVQRMKRQNGLKEI